VKAVHFYDELMVFKKEKIRELCRKIEPLGVY
jgi:hypothetical protein